MHCLNLKITYECNNRCEYCFCKDDLGQKMQLDGLIDAVKTGYENGAKMLVISGGEPTLLPKRVTQIITYAKNLGYEKFILQTNGSGISIKLADFLNSIKNLSISFSLLGASAKTHDFGTKNKGSFDKLLHAISLIKCEFMTNTVISKTNIDELDKIALLIKPYKPKFMQFAMMHSENNQVGLKKSLEAILKIAPILGNELLRTEGITPCLLKGYEACVSENYFPKELDLYNKNKGKIFRLDQLASNMRFKADFCKSCICDSICHGVWIETKDEFLSLVKNAIN